MSERTRQRVSSDILQIRRDMSDRGALDYSGEELHQFRVAVLCRLEAEDVSLYLGQHQ